MLGAVEWGIYLYIFMGTITSMMLLFTRSSRIRRANVGSHGEAVLTLRDMTSDAQTPLAHATMLRDTSGFQWHVSH